MNIAEVEQVYSKNVNQEYRNHKYSHEFLTDLVNQKFKTHPFSQMNLNIEELKLLLADYLAMSVSFPYLQASACGPMILNAIKTNTLIRREVELTSVVGAFLVWDELGGWFNTSMRGYRGLPKILDTNSFHANILRDDLVTLFGEEIQPHFSSDTREYLLALYHRLSHSNDLIRCAAMTSFELHAERMIHELWNSLYRICGIEKNRLRYFMGHVGGSDPAEAYHVKMTEELIGLITQQNSAQFEQVFIESYQLHVDWCQSIHQSAKSA